MERKPDKSIIEERLKTLEFWDKLTESERATFIDATTKRSFDKGALLSCSDCACMGMIFVLSGTLRVSIMSEEGREITLYKVGENGACVLSSSCVLHEITFESVIVAKEPSALLVVGPSVVTELMESNIYFKAFVYQRATERFSAALFVLQEIIFIGFDKRLASYLLTRAKAEGTKELVTTQEEIAVEVGSSREVVTRMLRHFMADDVIIAKRGKITILDQAALEEIAYID